MSNLSKLLSILLIITILLFGRSLIMDRPIYQGEIAMPIQIDIKGKKEMKHSGKEGEVELLQRAQYELKGVVKSKKKYSDFASQISEYDLTMAWGDLNKVEIDKFIRYSQSGRWYYYRYEAGTPVGADYISKHSANVHIIHKNNEVLNQIKKINEGDHIILKGYLVDVDFKNRDNVPLWKTSRTRNDTGDGACEIMYVEEVTIIK